MSRSMSAVPLGSAEPTCRHMSPRICMRWDSTLLHDETPASASSEMEWAILTKLLKPIRVATPNIRVKLSKKAPIKVSFLPTVICEFIFFSLILGWQDYPSFLPYDSLIALTFRAFKPHTFLTYPHWQP